MSTSLQQIAFQDCLLTQGSDPNSKLSKYLDKLMLEFILKELAIPERTAFIQMLKNNSPLKKLETFVKQHIADFDQQLTEYFTLHVKQLEQEVCNDY